MWQYSVKVDSSDANGTGTMLLQVCFALLFVYGQLTWSPRVLALEKCFNCYGIKWWNEVIYVVTMAMKWQHNRSAHKKEMHLTLCPMTGVVQVKNAKSCLHCTPAYHTCRTGTCNTIVAFLYRFTWLKIEYIEKKKSIILYIMIPMSSNLCIT